jgi:hypothetical protein
MFEGQTAEHNDAEADALKVEPRGRNGERGDEQAIAIAGILGEVGGAAAWAAFKQAIIMDRQQNGKDYDDYSGNDSDY